VYREEKDAVHRERLAARTVVFCNRHKIDCPAEVVTAVEKAVVSKSARQSQSTTFNKLTSADVKKRGAR
jgi:hypothetical protein